MDESAFMFDDDDMYVSDEVSLEDIKELDFGGNRTLGEFASPQVRGEQDVSGHMTDPESDDDMLESIHDLGLGRNATDEEPAELNMAEDFAQTERERRSA